MKDYNDNYSLPLFSSAFVNSQAKDKEILCNEEKECLLALSRIKGLGYTTIRKIYENYPRLNQIWQFSKNELAEIFKKLRVKNSQEIIKQIKLNKNQLIDQARAQIENLRFRNINLIIDKESIFPHSLKSIPNPPHWLFVEGNFELLNQKNIVAVVGTRNPTQEGVNNAKILTSLLLEKGFIVLSGLADGIDEVVHQTVIEHGGKTIGVLGTGISVIFPAGTGSLRRAIVDLGGCIISEYFLYDSYNRRRFIQRNRIQAALSSVVFPIQCKTNSGTSHTIRFAESFKKLVIGVKRGEPDNAEQNEVLKLLESRNHPIIDLDSEIEKLWELLKPIIEFTTEGDVPKSNSVFKKFNPVIREFEHVLKNSSISKEEIDSLMKFLLEKWELKNLRDGSQSNNI